MINKMSDKVTHHGVVYVLGEHNSEVYVSLRTLVAIFVLRVL